MLEQFKAKYIEEVRELLNELESTLLHLDNNPTDLELIRDVFRVMHTIKGTSGMYDFKEIERITHKVESIYGVIRDNKGKASAKVIKLTFTAIDFIREGLAQSTNNDNVFKGNTEYEAFFDEVESFSKNFSQFSEDAEMILNSQDFATYYILFKPFNDITNRGVNIKAILEEISELGTHQTFTHSNNDETESETYFYMFWEIFLVSQQPLTIIEDTFLFVQDEAKILKISDSDLFQNQEFTALVNAQNEKQTPIDTLLLDKFSKQIKTGDSTSGNNKNLNSQNTNISDSNIEDRIIKQQTAISEQKTTSIKVSSDKLDELMNLVSELVTTKAELSLIAEKQDIPELKAITEKIEKLSNNFKDNALSIRLVPIESAMLRFERLVRDLSTELGKKVKLVSEGTDTELDKTIIDNLATPLMHILRNSIDHGIESAERRKELKKSEIGIIKFTAFYSGANVLIQVQDDGGGIDPVKIKAKAIDKGFIKSDVKLTEKEMYDLIFIPGFSTAQRITGISGRGVGMDVVKQKILNLRGDIEVDSEVDLGTIVTIKLPLTLSIVDALLVKLSTQYFLIPLYVVDSCSQTQRLDLVNSVNQRIEFDDELVPFIELRTIFNMPQNTASEESIIFVRYKEKRVGLVVDQIIGEHQAVLKSLGEVFSKLEFISGGSVLGDGNVALILDTHKLIKQFGK